MLNTIVVIPAFNEQNNIRNTINSIPHFKVLVINDGSTDDTRDEIMLSNNEGGVEIIDHVINLGKTAAINTALDYIKNSDYNAIILFDADGQHNPKYITQIVEDLEYNDFVVGQRSFDIYTPLIFFIGNVLLTKIFNLLFSTHYSDTLCGLRGFRVDSFDKFYGEGYDLEINMLAQAKKKKLRVSTFFTESIYIDKWKGTSIFTGFRIFYVILKNRIIGEY